MAAPQDANQRSTIKVLTPTQTLRQKSMWGASSKSGPLDYRVLVPAGPAGQDQTLEYRTIRGDHSAVLYKCIDEVITNALDQANREPGVRRIEVNLDAPDGTITVFNDGPGISTAVHAGMTAQYGREILDATVAFGSLFAGSNHNKAAADTEAGTNGVGGKLTVALSKQFTVETCSGPRTIHLTQTWRGNVDTLDSPDPPRVLRPGTAKLNKEARAAAGLTPEDYKPHTRITFTPDYELMGYGPAPAPDALREVEGWVRMRLHLAAAHAATQRAAGKAVQFRLNGAPVLATVATLARLAAPDAIAAAHMKVKAKDPATGADLPPWHVSLMLRPGAVPVADRAIAQINGVSCPTGAHITAIAAQVVAAVNKLSGKVAAPTAAAVGSRLVIAMAGTLRGAEWTSQNKEKLAGNPDLKAYVISVPKLREFAARVFESLTAAKQAGPARTPRHEHDQYTPRTGPARDAARSTLCLTEGSSASTAVLQGCRLNAGATGPLPGSAFDKISGRSVGVLSVQGVPPNAVQMVTAVGGVLVRQQKLTDNKRIASVVDALGLRYDRAYDTPAERATLKYGRVVICTDQDLDGVGKIAPLLLAYFALFWPALVECGFVNRLTTPIVRVRPPRGAPTVAFSDEQLYEAWCAADPARAGYEIKYYKGLAGHGVTDIREMFEPAAFEAMVWRYTTTPGWRDRVLCYYGADAAPRKEMLRAGTPPPPLAMLEAAVATRTLPVVAYQLDHNVMEYKRGVLPQQLPGVMDGLTVGRRKLLTYALAHLRRDVKVSEFCGQAAAEMGYHHGTASLEVTAQHLMFVCQELRLLFGYGQCGDMHDPESGSPRYVSVVPDDLLRATFPAADDRVLAYRPVDGRVVEPTTLAPVLPLGVLINHSTPTEGWSPKLWARDLAAVVRLVRAYAGGDPRVLTAAAAAARGSHDEAAALEAGPFPLPAAASVNGAVRDEDGGEVSYGAWVRAGDEVTVTALPLGTHTKKFLEQAQKLAAAADKPVAAVADHSSEAAVSVRVTLAPGVPDAAVGALLGLRVKLGSRVIMYDPAGRVFEGPPARAGYMVAALRAVGFRAEVYERRLRRDLALAELHELETAALVRFVEEQPLRGGAGADEAAASAMLAAAGYPAIDSELLHSPKLTPAGELRGLVLGPRASHKYLLDVTMRHLTARALEKRRAQLDDHRAARAAVGAALAERPVPGASIWLREVDALLEARRKQHRREAA